MAVTPETQTYLTATKAPAVTMAQVKQSVRTFLGGVGAYQAELAKQTRLLNDALMVETDANVRARLDLEKQVLGALRREVSEAETQVRDLAPICDQRATYDADFRAMAQPLGYAV
jgi:hypothetical protein